MANDANGTLSQQNLLALTADVGNALTGCDDFSKTLQMCAEAIVQHLGAAFARIWVLEHESNVLVLKASAGMYTNLDGAHSRMNVGERKIGRIALEKKAHLTNEVLTDPAIGDKEWARKNNMVAFAGHPLVIQDQVVGVIGMFAQHKLSEDVLSAFDAIADGLQLE